MKVISAPIDFRGELIDLEEFDTHMRSNSLYTGWKMELDGQVQMVFKAPTDVSELLAMQDTKDGYVQKQQRARDILNLDKLNRDDEASLTHYIKGRDSDTLGIVKKLPVDEPPIKEVLLK